MQTNYFQEIKKLRRINEKQRQENLRLMAIIEPKRIYPAHWHITQSLKLILDVLLAATGPKNAYEIADHLSFYNDNEADYRTIGVFIWKIRRALLQDGITLSNAFGQGWYFTPENKAKALAAIANAGGVA